MPARIAKGATVALVVLAGALAFWLWPSAEHPGAKEDGGRTVLVAAGAAVLPKTRFYALRDCLGNPTTCVNGAEGVVLTYTVSGRVPRSAATATVLTDGNCEPDRYGVSHCLNKLRLDGGETLVVRHDHNMGNDPCLAPGERVAVRALA